MAVTTRDQSLKPSCVWQEWGVTHWVFVLITAHVTNIPLSCDPCCAQCWEYCCQLCPGISVHSQILILVLCSLQSGLICWGAFPFPVSCIPRAQQSPALRIGYGLWDSFFLPHFFWRNHRDRVWILASHCHSVLTCLDLIGNFSL